jgi:hypothetical protein
VNPRQTSFYKVVVHLHYLYLILKQGLLLPIFSSVLTCGAHLSGLCFCFSHFPAVVIRDPPVCLGLSESLSSRLPNPPLLQGSRRSAEGRRGPAGYGSMRGSSAASRLLGSDVAWGRELHGGAGSPAREQASRQRSLMGLLAEESERTGRRGRRRKWMGWGGPPEEEEERWPSPAPNPG